MDTPTQKRRRSDSSDSQARKRACTDKGKQPATEEHTHDGNDPEPLSPSTGAKRSGTDLFSDTDDTSTKVQDTRAIYDANKQEIDEWYDEDYSRKQGILPFGKLLRSKHRWYEKLVAWMDMKGMSQTARKKRKLNDGTPKSGEVEARPLRPHQIRYPDDLVSVPEYPLDRLEDYTRLYDGTYACSHVHLRPPKGCCKFGLKREAKQQSIKKSILRWKANVEKLIDKKQLDKRHMTWPDWTVSDLRKKHQKSLWDRQEAKRLADTKKRKEGPAEMSGSRVPPTANEQGAQQHPAIQRTASVTSPGPQPSTHSATTVGSVVAPTSAIDPPQQSVVPTRRQSDPSAIDSAQNAFLTNLARTNPRLLRSHDALYHDAQYRENLKEHANFAHLREWYLVYFLEQQRQLLSAEQRMILKSGDPSYNGKKRVGGIPTLERVDRLFSKYIQAARAEKVAQQVQQQPQESKSPVGPQASSTVSPTLMQHLAAQSVRAESPAQADGYGLDVYQEAVETSAALPGNVPVSHPTFEIMDYDRLDSELDCILGTGPAQTAQPAVCSTPPPSQNATALRTEASYITQLPRAFATGNQTVDDEMQGILEYAYQTDASSSYVISQDEQLLRQTIEDGRPDWQRYCDFLVDDDSLAGSSALLGQPVIGEFDVDVGERLGVDQLALLDFDDPIGRQLFAELDERLAATHAANLARYR